jgi:hypothetical protein
MFISRRYWHLLLHSSVLWLIVPWSLKKWRMRLTERREIEVYMAISSGLSSEDSWTTIQWTAAGILLPFVMVADGRQQSCPTPTDLPMPKISKLRILSSVYYKIIVLIHRIKTRYYRRQSVQCSASYVISFGSYLFRFEFQAPPTDPKRTVIYLIQNRQQ